MPALAPPEPPLCDGVVALRGWRDADAPALVEMFSDDEIARWTHAPSPYRHRDATEWLMTQRALMRRGERLALAVVEAHDAGALLGSVELRIRDAGRGELGYAVARWARRQGVGTRALRLYAEWAFAAGGRERLEALVHPDNVASLKLVEGIGFRREGVLRSYAVMRGLRVDLVTLSLLPGELRE
jgi:RimJ/RimL family protein N-acetyltransferase